MIKVTVIDGTGINDLDTFDNLDGAIRYTRDNWMETEESECYVFQDDTGDIVATMLRHNRNPELCITTYDNGRCDTHRCHYVLDEEGRYNYTEINQIL